MDRRVPGLVARLVLLLAVWALAGGCEPKPRPEAIDFEQELPAGQKALRKIGPEQYPDFAQGFTNLAGLVGAIDHSLAYMAHPSSRQFFPYLDISHERAVATLRALRETAAVAGSAEQFNRDIRARFDVYKSVGAPGPQGGYTDKVLFTAYCTPIYEASLTRGGPFQWPLYKRPADVVLDDKTGEIIGRRAADGRVTPYYTRQEIERDGKLAGQELVWLKDRFEAYVVTIQGSAKARLPDGRMLEIGYAGTNGHEYTSPGLKMIEDGVLTRRQLSIRGLRTFFRENPAMADKYLWLNKRTVFFAERPGGPFGSLNVPVTAFRTIATDKAVYPRALPAFVSCPMPGAGGATQQFQSLALDQDTGGAIRAAGRCDIYAGIGPDAERLAGQQYHEGELYYLAVKTELVPRYTTKPAR